MTAPKRRGWIDGETPCFQFTMKRMLLALFWAGVCFLATTAMVSNRNLPYGKGGLVIPLFAISLMALLVAIGALLGRARDSALLGLWLVIAMYVVACVLS